MHILFITDNFYPEINAPAYRTFEHCSEWVSLGHKVTVVTGAPNFPEGKVHLGYKNNLWNKEEINGINIIRVWTYISPNQGSIRRIIDFLSFMVTSCIAALFVKKPDIIIGTSPQFFTICSAYVVSIFKNKPWVFELRDLWPESIKSLEVIESNIVLKILERIELFLYKRANAIISVTNSFKENLIRRGISSKKIYIVTNGVNTDKFYPKEKNKNLINQLQLSNKFLVGYIGTIGLAHGLDFLINAAKILNSQNNQNFHFLLIGSGAQKEYLIKMAEENFLSNITFVSSVPKDEVIKYWSILDLALIHLKKNQLFKTVIPSKIFESMAMGIPILHGVDGESREIILKENVGIYFEPENPQSFINSVTKLFKDTELRNNLSLNGPIAAKKFSRKELSRNMLEILLYLVRQTTTK